MTPDQQKEVYEFAQSLKANASIPMEVDAAFRARLAGTLGLTVSAKGASEEDVSVNEGGAGSYAVMGDPDGFLEVEINGTIYYLPYFT